MVATLWYVGGKTPDSYSNFWSSPFFMNNKRCCFGGKSNGSFVSLNELQTWLKYIEGSGGAYQVFPIKRSALVRRQVVQVVQVNVNDWQPPTHHFAGVCVWLWWCGSCPRSTGFTAREKLYNSPGNRKQHIRRGVLRRSRCVWGLSLPSVRLSFQ